MPGRFMILWTCLAWLALVPAAAQRAAAEETQKAEPPEYRALVDAGLDEYANRNFPEARALFIRAHAILPSARTLRGLGMVEFELKNYDASVLRLEAALASTVRPLEGQLRQDAQDLLVRARAFVGRFALQIEPAAAADPLISLDGDPVTLGPNNTLTVPVGEHVLSVQAHGFAEQRRTLSVQGSEDARIVIALRKLDGASAPPAAFEPMPKKDNVPLKKNPWLWSGVGAVVLGGIVAAVVLSLPKDDNHGPKPDLSVRTLLRSR
jgi:tetratricopeptide (TPR) repeat protein